MVEIGLILTFIIAGTNYFLGARLNRNHADKWLKLITPVVKDNFKVIGTNTPDPDKPILFEDNSAHEYPLMLAKR